MTLYQWISSVLDWLLADPCHLVAVASAIAASTPTPPPDSVGGKLYKVIDILALNFLNAKEIGKRSSELVTNAPPSVLPILILSAFLSACTNQSPSSSLFETRATYDAVVLAPLVRYHALPPCPVAGGVCKDPGIDQQLIKADSEAKAALDEAESIILLHPETDPTTVMTNVQQAITVVQTILTANGVK